MMLKFAQTTILALLGVMLCVGGCANRTTPEPYTLSSRLDNAKQMGAGAARDRQMRNIALDAAMQDNRTAASEAIRNIADETLHDSSAAECAKQFRQNGNTTAADAMVDLIRDAQVKVKASGQ